MREYGVFSDFWNGHPSHLPLLGLEEDKNRPREWNLNLSLQSIRTIMDDHSNEEVLEGIKLLLQEMDWRPHLVALIAILQLVNEEQKKLTDDLWKRLHTWSWVSPQILVVLSMIDVDFKMKAEDIAQNGFKVKSMFGDERKTPDMGTIVAQEKIMAATHFLLTGEEKETPNSDGGSGIAKRWKENLLRLVEKGGIRYR